MRVVFMGSPGLAVPSLEAAARVSRLVGVVTQPPRPRGRGLIPAPSPVGAMAGRMGIEPLVPESVRTDGFRDWLAGLSPDLAVVVAYGKILPRHVLDIPRNGCVNVHASLLPELRGAAPIQWAVARGHRTTGVTLMRMDEGMDTGPILLQRETPVGDNETAVELSGRIARMAAAILEEGLPLIERGDLPASPQDDGRATYAPRLRKEDGAIDWSLPAGEIAARVRGFQPWPGCFAVWKGHALTVTEARAVAGGTSPAGTVTSAARDAIEVACGSGALRITRVKPAGKREMTAGEYLAGHPVTAGERVQ